MKGAGRATRLSPRSGCRPGILRVEVKIKVYTDTGVRKTILNRKDWFKIKDDAVMVKTKIRFRPYGTNEQLPIRGRAKVQLRAKAGATIIIHHLCLHQSLPLLP